MEKTNPVIGHHSAWGLTSSSRYKVEPYKHTPGATDTMCVRVREKIDIKGVGVDVIDMEGIFTVRRDHACPVKGQGVEWGNSCVKTEFRSLELYGQSPVFGTVRVYLDPEHSSNGEVSPGDDGSLAAKCVAHCYPTIELPDLGLSLTTSGTPIKLASKVVQIPPVGDVARSENSASLVDQAGEIIGELISSDIEVGEIICSFPIGSTGGGSEPHVHATGVHDTPSGPSFYTSQPTDSPVYTSNPGSAPAPHTHGAGGHDHGAGGHDHSAGGHDHGSTPAQSAPDKSATVLDVLSKLETELSAVIRDLRQQLKKGG